LHRRNETYAVVCDDRHLLSALPHFHYGLYNLDKAAARPYLGVTMGWKGESPADRAGVIVIAAPHLNRDYAVLSSIEQNEAVIRHARLLICCDASPES